jgi:hypothetical protein
MLDSPLKEEIEGLILQYKGKVAAIPSNETAYIVADLEKSMSFFYFDGEHPLVTRVSDFNWNRGALLQKNLRKNQC